MVADSSSKSPSSSQFGDVPIDNYKKGTAIWLPCPITVWTKATLVKDFCQSDGRLNVQLEDGSEKSIPINDFSPLPFLCNPDFLIDTSDLTTLSYLHEPDVLYSLKYRFDLGHIYTYCGIVLVAINPYRECDLYGCNIFRLYRDTNVRQLDPHVYAVAEEAFAFLTRHDKNQSIIISGESGAGKTVSAKYVMQYLAEACSTSSNNNKRVVENDIEKRVLASNPIMEAIGNAKTTRNDNSSRFGKFIQLLFARNYAMSGANMKTYLLEKSRVVYQNINERNYHIFYQMCAARDNDPVLNDLFLNSPEKFAYLNKGRCVHVNDIDDAKRYLETKQAMQLVGIDEDFLRQIFTILSGLLQFGNVNLNNNDSDNNNSTGYNKNLHNSDKSGSSDPEESETYFTNACRLWGVDKEELRRWLQYRRMKAGYETLNRSLTPQQTISARDATAKLIYLRLFNWIVERINYCLRSTFSQQDENHVNNSSNSMNVCRFVGVLDIYGFEIFESNSFEQLCINYANEMLQQQFNQHVFKLEQAEYVKEGIQWSFINFSDNQPCLDLIEGRYGILDLLDQECKLPKPLDENWLNIMTQQQSQCLKSPYFSLPRIKKKSGGDFIIDHFAGMVKYSVQGFVEKNVDSVNEDQIAVLKNSKCQLLVEILHDQQSNLCENGMKNSSSAVNSKRCLASQFKESLHELRRVLDSTMPHYIRCIKPNDQKLPFNFCVLRTVEQLRACGVLETIRISASGYPSRWTYEEFSSRYRMLLTKKEFSHIGHNTRSFASSVCSKFLQTGKYESGKTKVFFRTGQVALLESIRSEKLCLAAICIQKTVRGFIQRRRYAKIRNAVRIVQAAGRAWICWRYYKFMQMHRAAICLQKNYRSLIERRRYLKLVFTVRYLQATWRANLTRKELRMKLLNRKVIALQSRIRGRMARWEFSKRKNAIVVVQKWIRRFLARLQLKKLKVEARSVEHLQNLNKGLEIKIISLQQRLDKTISEREELRKQCETLTEEKSATLLKTVPGEDLNVARLLIVALEAKIAEMSAQMENFEMEVSTSKAVLETEIHALMNENVTLKAQLTAVQQELAYAKDKDNVPKEAVSDGKLNVNDIDQFLRLITTDYTNSVATKYTLNLPAYLLFMAVRHVDESKSIDKLQNLLNSVHQRIVYIITSFNDFDILTLWMANVWRFMQLCRQYSGEEEYSKYNTIRQVKFELKNHDLSTFRTSLTDLMLKIYEKMIDLTFLRLFTPTKIIAAVLEFDSSSHSTVKNGYGNSINAMKLLLDHLNYVYDRFSSLGVEWALSSQIFHHLFACIEAHALNVLMSRRDLCNFTKCVEIKHNIKTLLNWLRDRSLSNTNYSELDRLKEATNLLHARKTEQDMAGINDICPTLNVAQIIKLLTAYSPTESFEPKISADFIRKLEKLLKEQRKLYEKSDCLCLPTILKPLLDFPYVQSGVNFDEIKLPAFVLPSLNIDH